MCKVFSVIWNQYGTQNKKECSGYAESCQLSAELVKKGIYPKIEIQYINDDWDESMVDNNARNFTE